MPGSSSRAHAGFTLLETILVLLIAGIIIGGVWLTYSQAVVNDQVARTVAGIDYTLNNARDLLINRTDVPSDIDVQLRNANGYSPSFRPGQATGGVNYLIYVTPTGGNFWVSKRAGTTPLFEFQLAGVSPSICTKLATALLGNSRAMQERGIVIFGFGSIIAQDPVPDPNNANSSGPPTQAQIISNCATANRTTAKIALVYTLRP